MIKKRSKTHNKNLYILYPGDFHATGEDCIISTVVGQSIALCLYDTEIKIGGMVIFIAPGTVDTAQLAGDEIASQAIGAIEYLLGDLVKLGGDRRRLKAKVFGSGYTSGESAVDSAIIDSNISFINEYLKLENISITEKDLGGSFRRRVLFFCTTGESEVKKMNFNEERSEFIQLEKEYIEKTIKNKEIFGQTILFE